MWGKRILLNVQFLSSTLKHNEKITFIMLISIKNESSNFVK